MKYTEDKNILFVYSFARENSVFPFDAQKETVPNNKFKYSNCPLH